MPDLPEQPEGSEVMPARYERPRLTWIKRRARRLMRFYGVKRRFAIADAAMDYTYFVGPAQPTLTVINGGRA